MVQERDRALNITDLERRRDELTNDIAKADEEADGVALADAREHYAGQLHGIPARPAPGHGRSSDPRPVVIEERDREIRGGEGDPDVRRYLVHQPTIRRAPACSYNDWCPLILLKNERTPRSRTRNA